jgi:hypothetical protein
MHVAPLGVQRATFEPKVFQELWKLVNYMDYRTLPDLPIYTLSSTYANRQVKTLGLIGTQAPTLDLRQLYDRSLALQQSQPWHYNQLKSQEVLSRLEVNIH